MSYNIGDIGSRALVALAGGAALLGPLGCGPADDPEDGIIVGILLDYTGDVAATGFNLERTAITARRRAEAVRRPGEAAVRFLYRDAQGDPERAAAMATELADEGASVIIGPSADELVDSVFQVIEGRDVLLVSPTATARGGDDTRVWVRLSPGNAAGSSAATLYGENLAKYLVAEDRMRVAVVREVDSYHDDFTSGFITTYQRLGGEVAAERVVTESSSSAVARDRSVIDPELSGIVLALDVLAAARFVSEAVAVSAEPPQWYFTPRLKSSVFLLNIPTGSADGAIGISPDIPSISGGCPDPCFRDVFEAEWNETPFEQAYFMYDATVLVLLAIHQLEVQETSVGMSALSAAIVEMTDFGGVQVGWNDLRVAAEQTRAGIPLQYSGLTGPIEMSPTGERQSGTTSFWTVMSDEIIDLRRQ